MKRRPALASGSVVVSFRPLPSGARQTRAPSTFSTCQAASRSAASIWSAAVRESALLRISSAISVF